MRVLEIGKDRKDEAELVVMSLPFILIVTGIESHLYVKLCVRKIVCN